MKIINDSSCGWLNNLEPRKNFKSLNQDQKCDYLIIGAGYTGLSAARKLSEIEPNKKINQSVSGNTNTVYINPLNSLRFVLNKVKKDKINLNKDFWVFTGSSVGVVPIKGKGLYTGKVDKLGSVKAVIR